MNRLTRWAAAATLAGCAPFAAASDFSALYVFGDSLSDSGNIALALGANPGQVITGNSYIPTRPYASNQFTDGDVWARTFATALGLPLAPSLSFGGTNYAYGGARVTNDSAGLPPSLRGQVNSFISILGPAPSTALYVLEGGGNDARDALQAASQSATPALVIAQAAQAYATAIGNMVDALQADGAQHIVVWDVPNLGLAPAVTALGANAASLGSQVSMAMNGALSTRLSVESGVTLFDTYGVQTMFAANPAAYGLVNATDACGAVVGCDPWTYLFWDGIHPTSAGHALLAQAMLAAVPEPATWAMLIGGLLVVGSVARRRRG